MKNSKIENAYNELATNYNNLVKMFEALKAQNQLNSESMKQSNRIQKKIESKFFDNSNPNLIY